MTAAMEQATSLTNGYAQNGHEEPRADWNGAPFSGDAPLILYGTVTGNAELLANRLAARLRRQGITARVRDMAHCHPDVLSEASCVLFIMSTYGDGEPPDDVASFWEEVVRGKDLDLRGVKFSVLALGNTTYDQFCKCGRDLDAALERHGGIRLYPRIDCDAEYEVPAKYWFDGVAAVLQHEGRAALTA